jgi:hypothetical protein
MAYIIRTNKDGRQYQEWYYSVEDLQRDVLRYQMTPARAAEKIEEIRSLIEELLVPETTDARRATIVTMLHRRLCNGFNKIEDLAPLSKIASGR